MSDPTDIPAGSSDPNGGPSDDDLGEPVAELAQLTWQSGDAFGRKVTGSIERRILTGRLLDVAWTAPLVILLEFLRVPFESLRSSGHRRR